jgi:GMP synthase-like glutamine amidotransferase
MRDVVILRFSPTEGPGYFAEWLSAHAIGWRIVAVDEGAAVPAEARAFAGIAMMGGPMSVNDPLPWIEQVCSLLREALAAGIPVIGHCLGGQLLAKAMGAPVERAPTAEIGWIDVDVDDRGAGQGWFGGRTRFETFQWHGETFGIPQRATRVLSNRFNVNQAYLVDERHLGLQCHVEMTAELVESWVTTGASELPAVSTPARQSAADIRAGLPARLAALRTVADDVYARWAQGLRR